MGFEPRYPGAGAHCAWSLALVHSLSLSAVGLRVGSLLAQFRLPPTVGPRAPPRDTMAPGRGA